MDNARIDVQMWYETFAALARLGAGSEAAEREAEETRRLVDAFTAVSDKLQKERAEDPEAWVERVRKGIAERERDPVRRVIVDGLENVLEDVLADWDVGPDLDAPGAVLQLISAYREMPLSQFLSQIKLFRVPRSALRAIEEEPWRSRFDAIRTEDVLRGSLEPEIVAADAIDFLHVRQESKVDSETLEQIIALSATPTQRMTLAYHLLKDFSEDLPQMVDRMLDLASLALLAPPGPLVADYLSLLRRCYVAGFDAEAVIVCRSLLEACIKDKFQRNEIERPSTMSWCVAWAQKVGWLSPASSRTALQIWKSASETVHGDRDFVKDAIGTIKETLLIARELQS